MAKRGFYEVLGIERGVNETGLKKACRRLTMKYRPDCNPGDKEAEDRFEEANEAHKVLSDANEWTAYDQYGHADVDPDIGGGAGASFGGASFSGVFGDVFNDLFGSGGVHGGSCGGAQCGADLRYTLDLNLEEAIRSTTVTIRVSTLVGCKTCNGGDAKPGTTPVTCTTCGGIGQVRMQQGFFSVQRTYSRCHGTGEMISDPCSSCHGQGCVKEQKTLSVKVPAGVDAGDRIRLADEGEAGGMDDPAGDLYVVVNVCEHPIFQRDGEHLYCEVPISSTDAVLGGELEMPTLDGRVKLKIPKSTQTSKLLRLRDRGTAPVRGDGASGLMCKVVMETPMNLDKRQRELFKEFRKSLQSDTSHSFKASG